MAFGDRTQYKTGSGTGVTSKAITMDSAFTLDGTLIVSVTYNGAANVSSVKWQDSIIGTPTLHSLSRLPGYPVANPGVEGGGIIIDKWAMGRLPTTVNAATITVAFTASTSCSVACEEFEGVRRFSALDDQSTNTDDGSTLGTGTATPSEDDMLCHALWGWYADGTLSVGPTNSYTNTLDVVSGTAMRLITAHKVISSIAAQSSSVTQSGSTDMAAGLDLFRKEPADQPNGSAVDPTPIFKVLGIF